MNTYTLYPTPAPTPYDLYDRQMNGLHIDGIFWFFAFFGSWFLWGFFKAWSYKPRKPKIGPMPSKWEIQSENWRN